MRLINGIRERVPGAKISCVKCEKELDESLFYFNKRGYSTYCIPCHKIYLKEHREAHKDELVGQNGVTRVNAQREFTDIAFGYKHDLKALVRSVKLGDTFTGKHKQKLKVIQLTGRFAVMKNVKTGVTESFLWDDVYKLANGTYAQENTDDD